MTWADHKPTSPSGCDCGKGLDRHRPTHVPSGPGRCACGALSANHRVEHTWRSGECCNASKSNHRSRPLRESRHRKRTRKTKGKTNVQFFHGIDGEGKGRNPHIYTTLCIASHDGSYRDHINNSRGLSTNECLEFILSAPTNRLFAYSFGYDFTKIFTDLDNESLYILLRPDLRRKPGRKMPTGITWNGYYINLLQTRLTIKKGDASVTIWDIWKFYQSKFTKALKDWKIEGDLAAIGSMKDKRAEFDKLPHAEVLGYCYLECQAMGELAKRLIEAHETAGLTLKNFYGAGSTASAILSPLGIAEKRGEIPDAMQTPVKQAFFGGRFEHSIIGAVNEKVYGYDISSAYPYQLRFLPCLLHGSWKHSRNRSDVEKVTHALVRYSIKLSRNSVWAPFPFRTNDGTITFPSASPGGWLWRDEYLAGERLFSGVKFHEAWILDSSCDCIPFEDIPRYYLERLKWGKEGPGIVLKLGINSVYGKLAQSIGNPRFASWVWAGMVTSGTRAQILDCFGRITNSSDILAIATDGIYSRVRINPGRPRDTGTFHVDKPLGGWEEKIAPRGMFFARPGIYWPLEPTEAELSDLRARGLGRAVLAKNWRLIQEAWESRQTKCGHPNCQPCKDKQIHVAISKVSRFRGAKTTITKTDAGFNRTEAYGEWQDITIALSLDPRPKRGAIKPNGRLELIQHKGKQSAPYAKAMSPEALQAWLVRQQLEEQPDIDDWSDYAD